MFADAVTNVLEHASESAALDKPDSATLQQEFDTCTIESTQDQASWLYTALDRLDGVHLLPCHIKYIGFASVAELFRPKYLKTAAPNGAESGKLEVLLHGRWLIGQEQALCGDPHHAKLQGFVVATQEMHCTQKDLREFLSSEPSVDRIGDDDCIEAEEPQPNVTTLQPYAQFNKIWS